MSVTAIIIIAVVTIIATIAIVTIIIVKCDATAKQENQINSH